MTPATMSKTQKIVLSGLVMAIYIVVLFVSQSFSFGAYQMRLATALYALAYPFGFLVIPLGLANGIANTFGGLGLVDILGGFVVGCLTAGVVSLLRRYKAPDWSVFFPIFLIPSLVAPLWLSGLLGLPYGALVASLLVGQAVPGVLGVVIVKLIFSRLKGVK
ncbi:TPA: QueT transporter family protein [Streptococcus suis]